MEENFDLKLELEIIAEDITELRDQLASMDDPGSVAANTAFVRYDPIAVYKHVEAIKGHVEALELMLYPQDDSK